MLNLYLPKESSSIGPAIRTLFEDAGLKICSMHRCSTGTIQLKEINVVKLLDASKVLPRVGHDPFGVGITTLDKVIEDQAEVTTITTLPLNKNSEGKVTIELFCSMQNPIQDPHDLLQEDVIFSEFPRITERWLEENGIKARVVRSAKDTEADVPDLYPYGVCIVDSGTTLKANGLKSLAVLFESQTVMVCHPNICLQADLFRTAKAIGMLLRGTYDARRLVELKMNVLKRYLDTVVDLLPSMKAPTIAPLWKEDYFAVSTLVPLDEVNQIIINVIQAGAEDVIQSSVVKVI